MFRVWTQLWQVFRSPRNNIWDLVALVWHGQLEVRLLLPPLVSARILFGGHIAFKR